MESLASNPARLPVVLMAPDSKTAPLLNDTFVSFYRLKTFYEWVPERCDENGVKSWLANNYHLNASIENIREKITIYTKAGAVAACVCASHSVHSCVGSGEGWGRKSPWCRRRLLSDAAVVVVREYSAASGGARHFSTVSQKGCVSSSRPDFLTAPGGADSALNRCKPFQRTLRESERFRWQILIIHPAVLTIIQFAF